MVLSHHWIDISGEKSYWWWVVNKFPWYAGGIHQCICTHIREVTGDAGGKEEKAENQEETFYYPVQYN